MMASMNELDEYWKDSFNGFAERRVMHARRLLSKGLYDPLPIDL